MPAIACAGEPGPEEIAAAGGGIELVPAGDVEALSARLDALLTDPGLRERAGASARSNVAASFTWKQCGEATVQAYRAALG